MSLRDLFVAVADLDAKKTVESLLTRRQAAMGIQLEFTPSPPPLGDLLSYNQHDSGCYRNAVNLLRPSLKTHRHALLIFDRHGSGADKTPRTEIEADVEQRLNDNGWSDGRAAVVVIDPELEAWVWANSPHVADVLGWQDDRDGLRPFLVRAGLWHENAAKPHDPKAAMERALRETKTPLGAPLFSELAERVGIRRCDDPAFQKLKLTLQRWFPAGG